MSKIMPCVIAVSDFVRETREDINSPTTSGFVNRIPQCKETVIKLEEVRRKLFLKNIFLFYFGNDKVTSPKIGKMMLGLVFVDILSFAHFCA